MDVKLKILITFPDVPQVILDILSERFEIEVLPAAGSVQERRESMLSRIAGKDALLCVSLTGKIDREVLDKAGPQLKVISTPAAGSDHLDLIEIKRRGIKVGNTAGNNAAATAEFTVALTLATTRKVIIGYNAVCSGDWSKKDWRFASMCGSGLIGANIGIVGLGRIGLAVAKRLRPFEIAKIVYTGSQVKPEASEVCAEFVSLDELLRESDVIIITCSLNDSTRNMFGPAQFAIMKPTAILINTSRGEVIDQDALVHALKSGQIAAAGLDVATPEPLSSDHELTKLQNCVLTPHMAAATPQTISTACSVAVYNILNALDGKPMPAEL